MRISSALISAGVCGTVVSICLLVDHRFQHWFVIPLLACGTLITTDAVDWARRRIDLFDPIGVIGMLGCYFFFVAPLLCVFLGTTMGQRVQPDDWREWIGRMAVLNIGGILAYLFARDYVIARKRLRRVRRRWTLDTSAWSPVLLTLMFVSIVLQVLVYRRYGGVSGYISETFRTNSAFVGMGWVFMFSESFPILAAMAYCILCRRQRRTPGWMELLVVLTIFTAAQLLFGGLRGSRSNTVWALFWAVGMIHLVVRPMPRFVVLLGLGVLGSFMYAYGFYKSHGPEAWKAVTSASARAEMSEEGSRDLKTVLIADLSRSDIQAFILYRLSAPATVSDYQLAWGRTYVRAAMLPIPNRLLSFVPPSKTMFGTEAESGRGTFDPETFATSRVYGIAGETMLNFGPLAVPFCYLVLGAIVGLVKHWFDSWERFDTRTLLLPFLINLCFVLLVGDSDNVVFFVIKNGSMVMIAIILMSRFWPVEYVRAGKEPEIRQTPPIQLIPTS